MKWEQRMNTVGTWESKLSSHDIFSSLSELNTSQCLFSIPLKVLLTSWNVYLNSSAFFHRLLKGLRNQLSIYLVVNTARLFSKRANWYSPVSVLFSQITSQLCIQWCNQIVVWMIVVEFVLWPWKVCAHQTNYLPSLSFNLIVRCVYLLTTTGQMVEIFKTDIM